MKCTLGGGAVAVVLALAIGTVLQAAPLTGSYKSSELGGQVLMGRWSEGFVGGLPSAVGNGGHAQSWDGASLGSQWEVTGVTISSTTLLFGNPLLPTGTFMVLRTFDVTGGQLILKNTGSWWNAGDPGTQYTVNLTQYLQVLTVTTDNYVIKNATSTDVFAGDIQGYAGYKVLYGQAASIYEGQGSSLPANYAAWQPGSVTSGAWGTLEGTRFTIVPEPATVGLIGIGLAAMVMSRRKR